MGIKINETTSTYIHFTNEKIDDRNLLDYIARLKSVNMAKYRGIHLDVKLRWSEHLKKNVEKRNIRLDVAPKNQLDSWATF